MDPIVAAPRIVGGLPVIALGAALVAALLWRRSRDPEASAGAPGMAAVLPFALLFVAAAAAVVSAAAEAAIDSRVGIREASMLGLAVLFATPAIGWLISRAKCGSPGEATCGSSARRPRRTPPPTAGSRRIPRLRTAAPAFKQLGSP